MLMVPVNTILLIITYLAGITAYLAASSDVGASYSAIFLGLLFISIGLQAKRIIRIPGWSLNVVSMTVVALALFAVRSDRLVEPVMGTLLILMAIKFLSEKKARDYLQIHMLCIFVLVCASLLSLSILFLAYLCALALLSTAALMLLPYLAEDRCITLHTRSLLKIFYEALLICAISLPASLLFFLILPRTDFPVLSFLNQGGYAKAGFSDQVQLGKVAQIQQNNSVIFRAQMAQIPTNQLYWRGIVLDRFDGSSWKSAGSRFGNTTAIPRGPLVHQVIYLEPYGNRYLFTLDKPVSLSARQALRKGVDSYEMRHDIGRRIRYQVSSVPSDFLPETRIDRRRDLQLPPNFSPRIHALVEHLLGDERGNKAIDTLEQFLKNGSYRYSLQDLPTSAHPLEDFLFKYQRGNCEYFASALAVMLRMAGIPARLVGGYKGGYYNPAGGYYLVLENNAHVWVEAYLAGQGWKRLDPTPYTLANPSQAYQKGFLFQGRLLLDTFNYYWYKFIINYDLHKQLLLISRLKATITRPNLQFQLPRIPRRSWLLLFVPGLLLLGGLGWYFVRRDKATPAGLLLAKFLSRMHRHGYPKSPQQGLEEFALEIDNPELQQRANRFIADFEKVFYKDGTFSGEELKRLKQEIDDL